MSLDFLVYRNGIRLQASHREIFSVHCTTYSKGNFQYDMDNQKTYFGTL